MSREIQDIDYEDYKQLVVKLNQNDAWKIVAKTFGIFDSSDISAFKNESSVLSPAERLLDRLNDKLCTVDTLCIVLQECQLLDALAILRDPEPLKIIKQPVCDHDDIQLVPMGAELKLECEAVGLPPPLYQWYFENEELENQNSPALVIHNFGPNNQGYYSCCIRQYDDEDSDCCWTECVNVQILPEVPIIIQQPQSVICSEGSSVTLVCEVDGYPPPKYQWYHENTEIVGGNESQLTIDCMSSENKGIYRCFISNIRDQIWSDPARISICEDSTFSHSEETQIRGPVAEKVALLIGNDTYIDPESKPLYTPKNDVESLYKILTELQFKVIALCNLTLDEMRNAVKLFCNMLVEGSYALFYFAGHGFEINEKFMVPVDSPGPSTFLRKDCLCEGEVLTDVLNCNPKLFVMLLDMCLKIPKRSENPRIHVEIPETFTYQPNRNLIKGYSTTSNLGAYERKTDDNGIYVKHLKKWLGCDIPIRKVLDKVVTDVEKEQPDAAEQQMPSISYNTSGDHFLTDPVIGNEASERLYQKITSLPSTRALKFKYNLPETEVKLKFSCHKNHLNAMDIQITNLEKWNIQCEVQDKDLEISLSRADNILCITVFDLQKMKRPSLIINLRLLDAEAKNIVDYGMIELHSPLIVSAWLWYNATYDEIESGT